MADIFEIKARIDALGKIKNITYAMQIVTIARLQKLLTRFKKIDSFLSEALDTIKYLLIEKPELSQFLKSPIKSEEFSPLFVLFFSNRGFCGNFNQNILEKALNYCKEKDWNFYQTEKIFVGKKSPNIQKNLKFENTKLFIPEFDNLTLQEIQEVFQLILPKIKAGQPVYLGYAGFKSIVSQVYNFNKLFPISENHFIDSKINKKSVLVEDQISTVFKKMLDNYYFLFLNKAFLENACSEFGIRFMIMKNAVQNIDELKDDLFMDLNKERQNNINQELAEIISTFKALKINR